MTIRAGVLLACLLGATMLMAGRRLFGLGFVLMMFTVTWSALSPSGASLERFLRIEHRAGRLVSLMLTLQTSRDWAVAWLGARFLRRPTFQIALLAAIVLFWPVFSFVFLLSDPGGVRGLNPVRFVAVPSAGVLGLVIVTVVYLVGDAILTVYFELSGFVRDLLMGERAATSMGNAIGIGSYAGYAWGFPAVFGAVGQGVAKWTLPLLHLDGSWAFSIRFLGFVAFYVPASCLCQWVVIRTNWKAVQGMLLGCVRARAQILEERGTGRE